MKMIERVARKMRDTDFQIAVSRNPTIDKDIIFASLDRRLDDYRALASAAMEEMKTPTDDMVKVGVDFALNTSLGGDYRWADYIADKHRAMISQAMEATP